MKVFTLNISLDYRHSLLQEASTAKVSPLECFVIYGILIFIELYHHMLIVYSMLVIPFVMN